MAGGIPEPPWWRSREGAPRDRLPLTRDAIVEAALVVLERDGMAGLSMRKVAQELGAGASSLYWHVRDKEELLSLLLDRIVGEAQVPEPDPENWQEQVKELMRASRRLLSNRRDAAQLSLGRIPAGPNSLPVMERNLAVATASGLPRRVVALATDMFALYVGAFAYEMSLRVPPLGEEGVTPAQLADYFRSLPAEQFPNLTGLADDLTTPDADERFEFALELLVRGLEAMAEDRSGSTTIAP
ncbi:MAG TPA: TetR/AcrR family transcriptional regulator [Thermoleophilaceae bacterium]|jgi:AcrR family transcriptional regulator|nr:TetR/AcrR family transcriptional regulator [Thermoleophilaceae bacterium]